MGHPSKSTGGVAASHRGMVDAPPPIQISMAIRHSREILGGADAATYAPTSGRQVSGRSSGRLYGACCPSPIVVRTPIYEGTFMRRR